jgi:S-layer homology domain/Glucodextranase, domain B
LYKLSNKERKQVRGQKSISALVLLTVALCFLFAGTSYAITADPMDLSVGARSMGMGKAYVAVAEDSETVFINPAGLGTINSLKLGSMYTSLLDDLNYTVISGAYPLDNDSGTLGAGFINESTTGIPLYDIYGTSEGADATYGSQVMFLAYGLDVSKKFLPSIPGIYGGTTFKYFMQSATGANTSGLNGQGFSLDLGLLYKPKTSYISYGLNFQNLLSGSMTYQNGYSEPIASGVILGTKVAVLGDVMSGASMYQSDSNLNVAFDYDMGMGYQIPGTAHLGVEYQPAIGVGGLDKMLTLRMGMNQVAAPSGNITNLTAGVGVTYQGMEFNFAYSPSVGDIPQSSSSFFSLSYVGVPQVEKKIEAAPVVTSSAPLISEVTPGDRIVTKENKILVQGKVTTASNIDKVEINDAGVRVSDTGEFSMSVPLDKTGKHLIVVKATDKLGKTEEHSIRVIRLVKFADVADDHWADKPIDNLATAGLIEGYPNGTFQPERALSRAELATLLVKSKGIELPAVSGKVFKDVPSTHWASRYIKGALDMALVTGYPDKTFKPNNRISRQEGVVVMARFSQVTMEGTLHESPYPDLTAKNWASPYIAAAKTSGFLDYIGDKDFEPKKELTRAEACEILAKTSYGRAKIDTLYDWTVGFEMDKQPAVAELERVTPAPSAKPVAGKGIIPSVKEFSDVSDDQFASESIKYIATAGVMNGYPDNTFKPDRVVTRAELSAILVKAKGMSVDKTVATGYKDVGKKSWAAPYVKAAVDSGYMSAKGGNKFEPNRPATRAEAVAALVRFDNTSVPSDLRKGPFPDMTARDWSSKYVAAAKDAGMLGYLNGQDFEPAKSITRAELAEILAKTQYGQTKIKEIKSAGNYKSEENL